MVDPCVWTGIKEISGHRPLERQCLRWRSLGTRESFETSWRLLAKQNGDVEAVTLFPGATPPRDLHHLNLPPYLRTVHPVTLN